MICVPSGVTEVEKRAVEDAAVQAGARKTYLIEEPIAAAIGAGIDITGPAEAWWWMLAAELLILLSFLLAVRL